MTSTIDILRREGQKIVADLRASMQAKGKNVTGRTSRSIKSTVKQVGSDVRLIVSAAGQLLTLEDGRRPSTRSEGGALLPAIRRWAKDRNLVPNSGSFEGMVRAITAKIHKEGTVPFRTGKPTGVVSDVINERRINSIINQVAPDIARTVALAVRRRYGQVDIN